MCKELTDELAHGKQIATELVQHLQRMGAAKASIPVQIGADAFVVTVAAVFSETAGPPETAGEVA